MTAREVKKLEHGLYRIWWKADSGRPSLAAVGSDRFGNRWLAPTNWISGPSIMAWSTVERVELIEQSA